MYLSGSIVFNSIGDRMKEIIKKQNGVTIIELLAAFLILAILLVSVVGAILFGQKSIVGSDQKNNEAAIAQECVDEIITRISNGESLSHIKEVGSAEKGKAYSMDYTSGAVVGQFNDDKTASFPRQFYIVSYPSDTSSGYNIYFRSYYNNGTAQIDLTAFAKKNGN